MKPNTRIKSLNVYQTVGILEAGRGDKIKEIGLYNINYLKEALEYLDGKPRTSVRVVAIKPRLTTLSGEWLIGFQLVPTIDEAKEAFIVVAGRTRA